MRTTEIIDRLREAQFTDVQAREIAGILERHGEEQISKEYIESKFQAVDRKFEGVDLKIEKRFDEMDDRFEVIDERLNAIDKQFEVIERNFEGVNSKMGQQFKEINHRFEVIDRQFESMAHKSQSVRSDLQKEIALSKYDLVKWIVAGVVMNGVVSALLKYVG